MHYLIWNKSNITSYSILFLLLSFHSHSNCHCLCATHPHCVSTAFVQLLFNYLIVPLFFHVYMFASFIFDEMIQLAFWPFLPTAMPIAYSFPFICTNISIIFFSSFFSFSFFSRANVCVCDFIKRVCFVKNEVRLLREATRTIKKLSCHLWKLNKYYK